MNINKKDTAVLVTDRQNDFLSEKGVTWLGPRILSGHYSGEKAGLKS